MKTRVLTKVVCGVAVATLVTGCAMQEKQTMENLNQPVNCATAEGDIRVLQSEKAHVAQQIAAGLTAIYPAGAVMGILTGTEGTKLSVAAGDYNNQIDNRIAQIRSTCRV